MDSTIKPIKVNYSKVDYEVEDDEKLFQNELDKITEQSFANASITRTIKNIKETLSKHIKKKYNIKDKNELVSKVNKILAIHGMSDEYFDPMQRFSKFTTDKLNDTSVDANANKNELSTRGSLKEAETSFDKIIGYDYLYRVMKEMYGQDEAKRLSGEMYDLSLALSDSSCILIPYCYAMDATKLVTIGREFGVLPSKPTHSVDSYIGCLLETIHQMSNHLAGACLYKDMGVIVDSGDGIKYKNIKELIDDIGVDKEYNNYQGCWEYKDISDRNIKVLENNSNFVKVNKIMKRKYNKSIYNITTASGLNIKCSEDHKFKVLYKGREIEVPAKDLYLYDTVVTTAYNIIPVDKKSEDYLKGRMVGLIIGDGTINEQDVRLAVNNKQTYISDFCSKYIKDHNMGEGRLLEGAGCYDYHMTKKYLGPIVNDILGSRANDKNIDIKDKTLNYLAGFMDGYMLADGYYNGSLGVSSINKDLIKTVIEVCKIFGIKTSEIKEHKRGKGAPKPGGIDYSINISLNLLNYLDLFEEKRKQSSINKHPKGGFRNLNTINYVGVMGLGNSKVLGLNNKPTLYKNSRGSEFISKPYKAVSEQMREELKLPHTDTIINIEKMINDDEYVYEIETESHWYSVHGFLTHNCAIGSFFLDITHLLIYRHRISLDRVKNDKEVRKFLENKFQHFTHSVNSLSRNGGVESPFTNVSIFDKEKLNTLIADYGWYFPKKVQVLVDNNLGGEDYKLSEEEYKKFVIDYIFEIQKIFVDFFDKGDPSNNGLQYRFPIITINLTKMQNENGEYYIDENNELLDFITHKDIARYNIFSSLGTKICSCCRMINDTEMMDLGSTVNSFGGSGGISLGSHRVVTLNFARMAYEAESYDNYLGILNERVKSAAKILKAHKVLLFKMADMGQEPFIKNGWINMKRMFSTFGVLGLYEAVKVLKEKFDHKEFNYSKDILEHFSKFCKDAAKEEDIMFNIEQIPAESMAPRLATCDRILFGNPYNLDKIYANQFVPLWEDVTIYEKMDREGEMDHYLTGGSIAHIQIGSDVTPTQAKKIIQYATKAGCEHFALNAVYTKCEDCGNVIKSKEHKCPKCESENVTQYTRVVGFFTPVSSWNKDRREWEFPRRKFIDITK